MTHDSPSYTDRAAGLAFFLSRLFELDPVRIQNEAHALAVAARTDRSLLPALPWAAVAAKAAEAIAAALDTLPDREGVLVAYDALHKLDAVALDEAVSDAAGREGGHGGRDGQH